MKALVTGATGFIGSRLALRCLAEGDAVRALGQVRGPVEAENAKVLEASGAELAVASVRDRERLAELCHGIDVVFHLAAAQHEANVPDRHFHEVNVEGTGHVVDASLAAGVRRFVHGSTIGVYGGPSDAPISESSPLVPDNVYGVTKLAGEEVVRSSAGRLPFVIVRIGETYGPGDQRLLKLFRGIERGVFLRIGSCENLHALVFIEDLVDALRRAAHGDTALGRTFVIADPHPATTAQMIESIAKALDRRAPRLRVPMAPLLLLAGALEALLRPLGMQPPLHRRRMDFFRKSFAFRGEEARQLLDWRPTVDLDTGMRETARCYREAGLLRKTP